MGHDRVGVGFDQRARVELLVAQALIELFFSASTCWRAVSWSRERALARDSRGLGLTFCKLAVEAHGGRIWIEDAAPGAVFCARLPHGL